MSDIFEAIVIDTDQFYKTGTIKVKVFSLNVDKPNDLTEPYVSDMYGKFDEYGCLDARVFSPMAGGENYGIFYLPQVNSKGLVATVNDDRYNLIWMGSFFDVIEKQQGSDGQETVTINAPQDNAADDVSNLVDKGKDKRIKKTNEQIIIRTKSTNNYTQDETGTKTYAKENMDWDTVHTDNLIVIDNKKIEITRTAGGYNNEGELRKYQKFVIGTEGDKDVTKIEFVDKLREIDSHFKLENGNIKATLKKEVDGKKLAEDFLLGINDKGNPSFSISINDEINKNTASIRADSTNLLLSYKRDKVATYITQDEEAIVLMTGNSQIAVNDKEVTISSEKIRLSATNSIVLGGNNRRIVTTSSDGPASIITQDGAILYFEKNLRA